MSSITNTLEKLKISFGTVLKLYNTLQSWSLESMKSGTSLEVVREQGMEKKSSIDDELREI